MGATPLCAYFTNAANNAQNDAAGCWLLAAAAAGALVAAAVASPIIAFILQLSAMILLPCLTSYDLVT